MSTSTTPPALLAAMQTMLREAINRLVPPIVEQLLAAKVGTIVRGGRLQAGALVGSVPAPSLASGTPAPGEVPTYGAGGTVTWQPGGVAALTTEGDLLYEHAGAATRLPVGAAGQVLTVVAGDPAWATAPAVHYEPVCDTGGSVLVDSQGNPVMAQASN